MRDSMSMLESFVNSMAVTTPSAIARYAKRIGAGRVSRDVIAGIGKPVSMRVSIPGYGSKTVRLVVSREVDIGSLLDHAAKLLSECLGPRVRGDERPDAVDVLLSSPTILAHEHSRRILYKLFTDGRVPRDPFSRTVVSWLMPFIELNGDRLVGGSPMGLVDRLSLSLVPVIKCYLHSSGRGIKVYLPREVAVRAGAAVEADGGLIVTKYGRGRPDWLYVPVEERRADCRRYVTIAYVTERAEMYLIGTVPKPVLIAVR